MIDEATMKRGQYELSERLMSSRIDDVLAGIRRSDDEYSPRDGRLDFGSPPRIECMIHRVVLTGPYREGELVKLGPLKVDEGPIRRNYKRKFISNIAGFRRTIYTWPTNHRQPCCIEVVPLRHVEPSEYKRLLIDLMDIVPELTVSEAEYSVDVDCIEPHDAARLFSELMRHLWVPHKNRIWLPREKKDSHGEDGRLNFVYHIGSKASKMKLYERGREWERDGKGWRLRAIRRVRFEQTVRRAQLKQSGVHRLYDFIESCRFARINEKVYYFKQFGRSKRLPNPWDEYRVKTDIGGLPTPFEAEYLHRRKLKAGDPDYVKNLPQYLIDVPDFVKFRKILINQMRAFDREWEMA